MRAATPRFKQEARSDRAITACKEVGGAVGLSEVCRTVSPNPEGSFGRIVSVGSGPRTIAPRPVHISKAHPAVVSSSASGFSARRLQQPFVEIWTSR
jgi:hypothetical protein